MEQLAITKTLNKESFKHELSSVVSILNDNSIYSVNILFGFAWGNEYRNWIPFEIKTTDIESEIAKAEQLGVGKFGSDDFYVLLGEDETEIEILFCHEQDIHLSFKRLSLIVRNIIERWQERKILQSKDNAL